MNNGLTIMTTYSNIDYFQIVEISHPDHETIYKCFATWVGGYINGDEWRFNSGITDIVEHEKWFEVKGHSGSSYIVPKFERCYRTSGYTGSVLGDIVNGAASRGATVRVMDFDEVLKKWNLKGNVE